MKIAIHIVRTLLAALFLFASISYFAGMAPKETPPQAVQDFMQALMSVHLMTVIKVIELVCGVLLLVNFFAPLANVVLFPIGLNILLFHAFLGPKEIPMAIGIVAFQLFLAYAYRKNYQGLFSAKPL